MEPQPPKRPKLEIDGGVADEQEEALLALVQHRTKEVDTLKQKLSYYQSQLDDAESRLADSKAKLSRLRSHPGHTLANGASHLKTERESGSPGGGGAPHQPRPPLVIPAPNTRLPTPVVAGNISKKASVVAERSPLLGSASAESQSQEKRTKRKPVQKEHRDLIPSIRSSSSPQRIRFQPGTQISSQHKRKLRSLVLNPVDDRMFVTSALDGIVNLWQVQAKSLSASLLSSTDCLSPKQRKWPEDITWHPDGDSIFSVYSADGGDAQISILNLNSSGEKRVHFLEEKPHLRGIINSILFMPWGVFATGGSDHAVILWHEKDGSWKPKTIHRNQHSSAVMGVAGLQQKKVILSAGADKRIVGFDVSTAKSEFKHQIESKCMSVLPNPCDFNLFMVQTGAHGKQLRLFDIRLRQTEIHAFGWQQESSESQSALINQAWSPDGWYLSSGSADPTIHIFDIRYNSSTPAQSVQAHQKRVFKAVWHQSHPLLTSISSDLNIGIHKIA